MSEDNKHDVAAAVTDIQLLLAEKRTSLALMRTGIAVLALPLSVLSLLIATSKYYEAIDVLSFLIPLAILLSFLVGLGLYLIIRSIRRMHRNDALIHRIKLKYEEIAEYVD
ncbi:hypothetical protein UWK_01352 [Desulfocapsa sulfexigens DSM 10523]|uniref:DUF202 domain-containing protein n=1 Tax=Desulfocapsa sulfexigens (strain DSM 10523 / SB164P1) TaxID=1167006 RepID=M1P369_DESSD|nr:hypothetical protein [Desulfocapsa sulfexigens]AGF77913.1 hypothetical protein UWK_01352 [Desulfocapsa sulfexigens DSM 10523]